jgi:6-phosphogluconolactonase
MNEIEAFPDPQGLVRAATRAVVGELARPGRRSFVATGGGTPGPVYDRLSQADLDWPNITVALTDERWVDPSSPLSNEGLVRRRLLTGRAAAARFLPLKGAGVSPGDDAAAAEPSLRALAPFDAVLLGMGPDGHVASLFPGALDLDDALDPEGPAFCIGVDRPGLEPLVPRISLTLAALLASRLIVVLITGEEKRVLVERVVADDRYAPPIASILRQARTPVRVLWSA